MLFSYSIAKKTNKRVYRRQHVFGNGVRIWVREKNIFVVSRAGDGLPGRDDFYVAHHFGWYIIQYSLTLIFSSIIFGV